MQGISSEIYHISLKEDNSLTLHWSLDYNSEEIMFEMHIPCEYGWFALGFSDRGSLFPADYCLVWENLQGKLKLQVETNKL